MKSFIVTGEKEKRDEFINSFISEEAIPNHAITVYSEEIKIKQAKEIRLNLSKKYTEKRLLIISSKINAASQNALLKSFEELSENVSVIISRENSNEILDTIKSRFFLISLHVDSSKDLETQNLITNDLAKRFLSADKFIINNTSNESKLVIDEFLLLYRKELTEKIENIDSKDLKKHIIILKKLLEVNNLVKNNNLNLRLGLESALLV